MDAIFGGLSTALKQKPYTPTRYYPVYPGGPKHPEARYATNKRLETNLNLPVVTAGLARTKPANQGVKVKLGKVDSPVGWLGKRLDAGGFGTAFLTTVTPAVMDKLREVRQAMTYDVFKSFPAIGETVIIKVAKQPNEPLDLFVRDNLKEASVHDFLANSRCVGLPGFSKPLCAAKHVPRLYFCGLVRNETNKRFVYLTVMALAPGVNMNKHLETSPMTADLYVNIERATCAMWVNGLVHADMHKGNVMYDAATRTINIIDFGFGVLLPDDKTQIVRKAIIQGVADGVRSLGELWRDSSRSKIGTGLQAYTNRIIFTRKSTRPNAWMDPWYNPDGGALMRLYGLLSPADRAQVPALRRAAWGYTGLPPAAVAPPPAPMPAGLPAASNRKRQRNNATPSGSKRRRTSPAAAAAAAVGERRRSTRLAEMACKRRSLSLNAQTGKCVRRGSGR